MLLGMGDERERMRLSIWKMPKGPFHEKPGHPLQIAVLISGRSMHALIQQTGQYHVVWSYPTNRLTGGITDQRGSNHLVSPGLILNPAMKRPWPMVVASGAEWICLVYMAVLSAEFIALFGRMPNIHPLCRNIRALTPQRALADNQSHHGVSFIW